MVQHSMKPKSVSMRDLIIILMQTRVPCFEFCQLMFPFALLAVLLFMLESKHLLICKERFGRKVQLFKLLLHQMKRHCSQTCNF